MSDGPMVPRQPPSCVDFLNGPLLEDARRDWEALGGTTADVQPLDDIPLGAPIGMSAGILFLTYSTLRSVRDKGLHASIRSWPGSARISTG